MFGSVLSFILIMLFNTVILGWGCYYSTLDKKAEANWNKAVIANSAYVCSGLDPAILFQGPNFRSWSSSPLSNSTFQVVVAGTVVLLNTTQGENGSMVK